MVPTNLGDWDYELVKKFVEEGLFETDRFDFKEEIPNDPEKSVCAFANTEGGFLVFGIKDNRSLSPEMRIKGIDPNRDFPREFGDKIINIEPHVYYSFKNPPINIPDKKNVIHVIKIPQSPERPHMTSKREFYYRTNRGNVQMIYQQIKNSFLNEEQQRQKLRLLYIELLSNREQAMSMILPKEKISETYSLVTLDSSVLQTLLVDTYSIIINEEELIRLLITIREHIKILNNKIKIFFTQVSLPTTKQKEIIISHNEFINQNAQTLVPLLDKSLIILHDKYGLSNPFKE
jgi:hypothetical protein